MIIECSGLYCLSQIEANEAGVPPGWEYVGRDEDGRAQYHCEICQSTEWPKPPRFDEPRIRKNPAL